jgi:hypothetical protein
VRDAAQPSVHAQNRWKPSPLSDRHDAPACAPAPAAVSGASPTAPGGESATAMDLESAAARSVVLPRSSNFFSEKAARCRDARPRRRSRRRARSVQDALRRTLTRGAGEARARARGHRAGKSFLPSSLLASCLDARARTPDAARPTRRVCATDSVVARDPARRKGARRAVGGVPGRR